jgi:hypothetical protein
VASPAAPEEPGPSLPPPPSAVASPAAPEEPGPSLPPPPSAVASPAAPEEPGPSLPPPPSAVASPAPEEPGPPAASQLTADERLRAALPLSATAVSHQLLPRGMTLDSASGMRRLRAAGGAASPGAPAHKRSKSAISQEVFAASRRRVETEADKGLFWELWDQHPEISKAKQPHWGRLCGLFNAEVQGRTGAATSVSTNPEQRLWFKNAANLQMYHEQATRQVLIGDAMLRAGSAGTAAEGEAEGSAAESGSAVPDAATAAKEARDRRRQQMRSGNAGPHHGRDRALAASAATAQPPPPLPPTLAQPPVPLTPPPGWLRLPALGLTELLALGLGLSVPQQQLQLLQQPSALPPAAASGGQPRGRGGAGTPHLCRRCHWPVRDAGRYNVVHAALSSAGGLCKQGDAPVPCAVCAASVAQHTLPCVRPAGWEHKPLSSDLGASSNV